MRKISPFLEIYRPQLTSMPSILQRISGVLLILSILVILLSIVYTEIGLNSYLYYILMYKLFKGAWSSILVSSLIFYVVWVFVYHFLFGIRYVYWDILGGQLNKGEKGISMDLTDIYRYTGQIVILSFIITIIIVLLAW